MQKPGMRHKACTCAHMRAHALWASALNQLPALAGVNEKFLAYAKLCRLF